LSYGTRGAHYLAPSPQPGLLNAEVKGDVQTQDFPVAFGIDPDRDPGVHVDHPPGLPVEVAVAVALSAVGAALTETVADRLSASAPINASMNEAPQLVGTGAVRRSVRN
jgi:hypothetical protein